MVLTDDDFRVIRQIVREELDAKVATNPASEPTETGEARVRLPERDFTPEEVSTLIAAFSGINEQQAGAILKFRDVANAAEYLNGVMTKFGVTVITDIWHNAFQQLGPQAQFAGPFPWGPADVPATDGTEAPV